MSVLTNYNNHVLDNFDGMDEMLTHIDKTPPRWKCTLQSNATNDPGFYGTDTFDEAMNLAKYGWPDGLSKMSDALKETTKLVNPYICQNNYLDVAGAYPNVPEACAGNINNMVNFNSGAMKQKPVVKLLINTGANCMISTTEITNRGAAILSYADMLENAGYPVEIELYDLCVSSNSLAYFGRIIVKQAGARMDIDRMAFCLAHPAYLRRIRFRLNEIHTEHNIEQYFRDGYGAPRTLEPDDLAKLDLGLHVHFGLINNGSCCDSKNAIKLVKKTIIQQITKQGYELPALSAEEGAMT